VVVNKVKPIRAKGRGITGATIRVGIIRDFGRNNFGPDFQM